MNGQQELVGTGDTERAALQRMLAMEGRPLADSETDRAQWHAARASRVTATEAAQLRLKGAAFRRELISRKLTGEGQDLQGNRYIDRGHEREPVIADWAARRFPGIIHNSTLYAAEQNDRHAATPDGYGIVQGEFVMMEIKTSKHDLDPSIPLGAFHRNGYGLQTDWQMYVTGARRCLFVWEQHDDQWPDPQPLDLEPRWVWLDYDARSVEQMIAGADLLLAELDQALAGQRPTVTEGMQDLEALALAVLAARTEEATAKARREAAWKRMQTLLAGRESFSHTGLARITWSNDATTEHIPDEDAALAAQVAPDSDVTGRELKAKADAAQAAWQSHLAKHTREQAGHVQKLTVTAPKAQGKR